MDGALDVLCMGDVMIDFTPDGVSSKGNALFERNPGGAPANVAVTVQRLGGKSGFAGAVGDDIFGHFLQQTLRKYGVDTEGLVFSGEAGTRLAFIELDETGDRHFLFTKSAVAETFYTKEDLQKAPMDRCGIFHLASTLQYVEPAKSTSQLALRMAREMGKLISYDPNWNIAVSRDKAEERRTINRTFEAVDVVKVSESEIEFLYGHSDVEEGARHILAMGPKLVVVSLGKDGCCYVYAGGENRLPTYDTKVVDTTGAGDAFMGGLLYSLARKKEEIEDIPKAEMDEMMRFANACGAVCAGKRGGMPSVENIDEVRECMAQMPLLV